MQDAPPIDGESASGGGPSSRTVFRKDVVLAAGLMGLGALLRLAFASGYGLGDDGQWLAFLRNVAVTGTVPHDNVAYRFTWWLPTLVACRLFGFTESALVLPCLAVSVLGIGLVYAFGLVLAGRRAGFLAALLLVVLPIDFAWATMMTNDLFVSFFSGLALLCTILALEEAREERRGWLWGAAALALWLAAHAKLNALVLAPVMALACWRRRERLDHQALWFGMVTALLFGTSMLASHGLVGDALAPIHAEMKAQGLHGADAVRLHRLTATVFWTWLRTLFLPNHLGDLVFSVVPHALVALWAAGAFRGRRPPAELVAWLVLTLLALQFNSIRRVDGVWVAGFRNVRHAHVLAYPLVLLLALGTSSLRPRLGRWLGPALAALVALSLWQSVSAASKTRTAFADCRTAMRLLATLPPKPIYSDTHLRNWALLLEMRHPLPDLPPEHEGRRARLAAVRSGYCVTGGGREPLYGCVDCMPFADELAARRWRLLMEIEGPPPSWWRREPLRVWEAVE